MSEQNNYKRFLESYTGKELLKAHSLTEYGTWKVRGADSNCDFGGSHYMPEIGLFEGTLVDIIFHAVEMRGFWSWGPGDITLIDKPVKITAESRAENLKKIDEVTQLEARLKQLKSELKGVI